MELKDKTVLVTGSSSGIGQATAIEFAKKGATILVHYHKNKEGGEETLREVEKYSRGFLYRADLMKEKKVQNLFEDILQDVPLVDVLVNNAGDAQYNDFFDNELWEHQYKNIFRSALYVSQGFLKLPHNDVRKVVNISSIYGNLDMSNANAFAYSVAKASLNSLTVNMAKLFGPQNVLVNAVAPGYTWTPAWEGISEEDKKIREQKTFINRYLEPREIGTAAVFLAEHDAITGQIITVDGGTSII